MNAPFILTFLGWFCGTFALLPDHVWSASPSAPLIKLEIRYELPAAGEVVFFWGVNGWHPVNEDIRPAGTVIRDRIMSTAMVKTDQWFAVTIQVDRGSTVDYGFLVTKTAGSAPLEYWDGNESYRLTVIKSDVVSVNSVNLYRSVPILMDRAGAMLGSLVVLSFIGILTTAGGFLWLQPKPALADNPSANMDARFAAVVSLSALLVGLAVILQHEMWRDELQAWRIATSSQTLSELFQNARYEGHPPVWYLCLYVLSRFSDDPRAMQLFHLALGAGSVFLLCLHAPFTRWQKACLSFGYFPFYEYLVVSRNYALGVLALCAFCALQGRWPGRILISAILLAVMINTSAFGAIIALAFGGWLVIDSLARRPTPSLALILAVAGVLGLGLAVAGMQSAPPLDNSPRMLTWNTALLGRTLEKTVSSIWKAYVPLPSNLPHFWNTNVLDEMPFLHLGHTVLEGRDVQTLLSLGLLGICALLFIRTPSVMLLYTIATGGVLLFLHLKVNHGVRHTGHIFLVLLGCLWLAFLRRSFQTSRIARSGSAIVVTSLFAVHAVAGGLAAATDLVYPFSASKDTAEFIERHGLAETAMIGSGYAMAAAVAGYLNHPVYYAENKQTGTFVRWREKRTRVTGAEVVRMAEEQSRRNRSDILLILTFELGAEGNEARKLASFEQSIVKEERYWLYLLPYREERASNVDIEEFTVQNK